MQRIQSTEDFLAAPVGCYVEGLSYVVWVQSPKRFGVIHKSELALGDRAELTALFALVDSEHLELGCDLLHDLSALDGVDQSAFAFLEQLLHVWIDRVVRRVTRLAVVRPGGLPGAAVTGMFEHWIRPRFDARLCAARDEAYEFLEMERSFRGRGAVDDLYTGCLQSPVLRRLREVLAQDVAAATVARAAAALLMSTRSLQRDLALCQTTFRDELSRVRVQAAQRWLLTSDDKLETIASALGFSSAAAFSAMFAELTGEPPGRFRDRHRRAHARGAHSG